VLAGAQFDPNKLGVKLGPHVLMEDGQPLNFDRTAASAYLLDETSRHGTVQIEVCIGAGGYDGMAWGCDLSYDYVKINAEYTT
jgi:glutamate N-acetyltransferase / amino-acid N-acetyltransferase